MDNVENAGVDPTIDLLMLIMAVYAKASGYDYGLSKYQRNILEQRGLALSRAFRAGLAEGEVSNLHARIMQTGRDDRFWDEPSIKVLDILKEKGVVAEFLCV